MSFSSSNSTDLIDIDFDGNMITSDVSQQLALAPIEAKDLSLDIISKDASTILNANRVDWEVEKQPIYLGSGQCIPNQFSLVRKDTNQPLSIVGRYYQPNQNKVALSVFDDLVKAGLLEGYTNAGVFKNGKLAWIQAQIKRFDIGNDPHIGYLTLTISHGSAMTDRWNPSTTRIVCKNTFMMSRDAMNGGLTMGHTRKGNDLFQDSVNRIKQAVSSLDRYKQTGTYLQGSSMNSFQLEAFCNELFPSMAKKEENKVGRPGRINGIRQNVKDLFNGKGIGLDVAGVRGTKWAAFQAVTEYVDHIRTVRKSQDDNEDGAEDSRLMSSWFGRGSVLKQKALDLLTDK